MDNDDNCNALILPAEIKKKRKANKDHHLPKSKARHLSKNEHRKLRRLQEEKEKKEKSVEVLKELEKFKLSEDAYSLLYPSGTRGQKESMREKLRRAIHYERAGLRVPVEVPLLRERGAVEAYSNTHVQDVPGRMMVMDENRVTTEIGVNGITQVPQDARSIEEKSGAAATFPLMKTTKLHKEPEACDANNLKRQEGAMKKKEMQKKRKQVTQLIRTDVKEEQLPSCEEVDNVGKLMTRNCNEGRANGLAICSSPNFFVHVIRSEEVRNAREKLPIIMMEQEIMEAITENPVTIICGETGCGKTTQVPQFLYEAGFSSNDCVERSGMIGVTQPRRVAVLATAKRLSYEMNLHLGQEVGFQVRHDRRVGSNTRIKFMTDGILLREVQSDFLLRKYSVIVLDEAHERSLNTDILIGMLSRVLPLRQKLYEEQSEEGTPSIYPLKIIIMSATLLVDEFVANRRLFNSPPPIIEVPARQFPVTVHFSAKTELMDYVGKAYKKVCAIHRKLPPGGVLVFLTGQAEVHYLCKRLQKAFPKLEGKKHNKQVNSGDTDLQIISEAADGVVAEDEFYDDAEMVENLELGESALESDSESDLEYSETEECKPAEKIESKNNLEWTMGDSSCLESIKDAFDALTELQNKDGSERPKTEKRAPINNTGPLYVLPLYALLPATSQLKIFGAVPEGSRLVVVATNVAETSITIPGIRYVVDCGRAKEKIFERATGITRYEVGWISKASAAQRAGRSGRTGPGHCYRLYSSAIFNDTFPEYSRPEIYRTPIEGLVLMLKSMNIVKVNHFPFLSEPNKSDLAEAENCLYALSALNSNTSLLTPLGHSLSSYPISPRHSRMLLTAMQIGCSDEAKETCILLAYAGATVAALSLDSPFMTDINPPEDQGGKTLKRSAQVLHSADVDPKSARNYADTKSKGKRIDVESEGKNVAELDKSSRRKIRQSANYRHPLSDALGVVKALRAYEASGDPEEFCRKNNWHARILYEMSKLRKQLIHIYLVFSKERGKKDFSFSDGISVADVEAVWKAEGKCQDLSVKHEIVLRQAICAGWADRVARKVSILEMLKGNGSEEKKKHKAIQYQTCTTEEKVYIHPSSSLRKHAPDYVVFNELVRTSSTMRCSLKSKKHRIAVFACALLQGKVLPSMKLLSQVLAADPSILIIPSGNPFMGAEKLSLSFGKPLDRLETRIPGRWHDTFWEEEQKEASIDFWSVVSKALAFVSGFEVINHDFYC
ncbi:hypothetical protein GOP47_0015462 [Adiantum capillus-veneris]|uniref:RNA helicase n=1 Tax=Adiantum capillus-veneris TaxID=13818 RepID=A0A9D4ZE02_ADICA|nr:hypothetical protein GOP47_0015462 [Adiantum capillus-veneris]